MPVDIDPAKKIVREICKQLKPVIGVKADKIWRAYCFSDDLQRKEMETYLDMLSAKVIKEDLSRETIILVPPKKEDAAGPYYLGDIEYNNRPMYPFGLREHEWNQHLAILGRSGAGKTNLGFGIVSELVKADKDFLIFDWKRNYRDLLAIQGFEKLKVYCVGRGNDLAPLKFNPLIPPPNVNPRIWLKLLIEVISHAYFLGEGVAYLLQQAIDSVYREKGVYQGNVVNYPTFQDVLRWVKTYNPQGRAINWLSSTLRAVSTLCFGEMNDILNIDNNTGLEKLLREKAVLELDSLVVSDRILIVETLLLWIYQYRLSVKVREKFDHAIMIEEAHHILSQQKRSLSGGETIMETVFRQCRELGEGIIILDQQPSELSPFSLANTYTTIVMNLKYKRDVDAVNKFLLLDKSEEDYPIRLGLGEAIVKLQDRVQNSFLIRVPEFHIRKGAVTDDAIRLKTEKPRINYVPTDQEKGFLKDVHEFPGATIVQRYERLGLGAREGTQLKEILLAKGFIQQEDVVTENARIKKLRLTGLGMSELNGVGLSSGQEPIV